MSCLPPYAGGTTTWLSILSRFEHLLVFDVLLGEYIGHKDGDPTTVCGTDDSAGDRKCIAVASGHVMTSGVHYVEFNVTGYTYIGIVRPMPGLDAGRYREEECRFVGGSYFIDSEHKSDFLAQRSYDWVGNDIHACEYDPTQGELNWTDWGERGYGGSISLKESPLDSIESYDGTISIVLNLDMGTLTIFSPYPVIKDGLPGPYCWYASVEVCSCDVVSIKRGPLSRRSVTAAAT